MGVGLCVAVGVWGCLSVGCGGMGVDVDVIWNTPQGSNARTWWRCRMNTFKSGETDPGVE